MEVYCMLVPGWNRKDLYGHFCINHILLDFFFFWHKSNSIRSLHRPLTRSTFTKSLSDILCLSYLQTLLLAGGETLPPEKRGQGCYIYSEAVLEERLRALTFHTEHKKKKAEGLWSEPEVGRAAATNQSTVSLQETLLQLLLIYCTYSRSSKITMNQKK